MLRDIGLLSIASLLFLEVSRPVAVLRVPFFVDNHEGVVQLEVVPHRVGRRCATIVPLVADAEVVGDAFNIASPATLILATYVRGSLNMVAAQATII